MRKASGYRRNAVSARQGLTGPPRSSGLGGGAALSARTKEVPKPQQLTFPWYKDLAVNDSPERKGTEPKLFVERHMGTFDEFMETWFPPKIPK